MLMEKYSLLLVFFSFFIQLTKRTTRQFFSFYAIALFSPEWIFQIMMIMMIMMKMSADKCQCIFLRQIEAIIYIMKSQRQMVYSKM